MPFSAEEIKEVVVKSDGNKSPGPDGFNFAFFKSFWDLLKNEVGVMFDQFFVSVDLPPKLVSKVLAGRLAKVMTSLISPNQSAFIKGRQLVDGVVAVNEVIDLARKSKRWCSWIRACVFNGTLVVLVNGCPTEEINIQRGFKQGDPLAPFLFLLVVEGLSGAVSRAEELGMFKGFKVGNNGLFVSHLQYADDTLFLGEASLENLWTLKTILRCFELASGLKVNFAKSSVMGVNVSADFLNLAERFLHCSIGSIPFTYLGLPVGANPRKESTWKPLLVSLSRKLGVWRNRFISLGGRVVLLKSVMNSIPIFYLSFLIMPTKVWKHIVRIQRNFLWGGASQDRKIAWVSWDNVCRPKNCGGLGIRDLRAVNLALLGKWRWRVIVGGGESASNSDWFSQGVSRKVGNGSATAFWFDPWLGGLPLKDRYRRLFHILEQCLEVVRDMGSWVYGQWVWDFRWTRKLSVVWHAAVWSIWLSQNDLIFTRGTVSIESLVDKVKLSSWKWFLAKNLVTPAPSMSGRCNQLCAGSDRGWWNSGVWR
ncbi:hypothetical protein TSUD_22470 [Trifolium subterraneum]|uniref:Reverse transcriptase domain-containing protein n=1 Tax=Trifolium subterraneum TaxID=3900 RepID=A0A2Z6N5S7_TRISU|nr:hypothetical protein TSUD_22470 [Trifolium subterraneum]